MTHPAVLRDERAAKRDDAADHWRGLRPPRDQPTTPTARAIAASKQRISDSRDLLDRTARPTAPTDDMPSRTPEP
jgi:hypothetical protein